MKTCMCYEKLQAWKHNTKSRLVKASLSRQRSEPINLQPCLNAQPWNKVKKINTNSIMGSFFDIISLVPSGILLRYMNPLSNWNCVCWRGSGWNVHSLSFPAPLHFLFLSSPSFALHQFPWVSLVLLHLLFIFSSYLLLLLSDSISGAHYFVSSPFTRINNPIIVLLLCIPFSVFTFTFNLLHSLRSCSVGVVGSLITRVLVYEADRDSLHYKAVLKTW